VSTGSSGVFGAAGGCCAEHITQTQIKNAMPAERSCPMWF
jgi:hypothetical protein